MKQILLWLFICMFAVLSSCFSPSATQTSSSVGSESSTEQNDSSNPDDYTVISGLTELEQIASTQKEAVLASTCLGRLLTEENYPPDWYGGKYINKSNILIIKIVDGYSYIEESIHAVMDAEAKYDFEYTDISLQGLYDLHSIIAEKMDELDLISVGISETKSKVVVVAPDHVYKEHFGKNNGILNDPHIVLEPGESR